MIHIHELGCQPYVSVWEKMKQFTNTRTQQTIDELWILQHEPVFTQGLAGKPEHLKFKCEEYIPVVQSDRGGQITYHGPGQLVAYPLLDLKRRKIGIRHLVHGLEQTMIDLLATFDITGSRHCGAPGVYVEGNKIASLGLRVKNGCSYHGIAFNINMDLLPFQKINPCGFKALTMTQLADYVPDIRFHEVASSWINHFLLQFED